MSVEATRAAAARIEAAPQLSHVLACGATESAVEIALLLRRIGEAVALLADDLRSGARQALERAGVRIVIGPPTDPRALAEARAAGCTSAIEATHLAGCALDRDAVGVFSLGDELVLWRRVRAGSEQQLIGAFQERTETRVLMMDERDGRRVIAPSAALPIPPGAILTTVERIASPGSKRRPRIARAIVRAARTMGMNLRYAVTIGDRVFSFFERSAGSPWRGERPSDVAGSYNFMTLYRRRAGGRWRSAEIDDAFDENETILVAAWRRLD